MALIPYTVVPAVDNNGSVVVGSFIYSWAPGASTDTFSPVKMPAFADKTLQAVQAGGTPTWGVSGSNDPAAATFAPLHDVAGAAISAIATAGIKQILENPSTIRPDVPTGAGTIAYFLMVNTMARRG
jgi:hypothetical protein